MTNSWLIDDMQVLGVNQLDELDRELAVAGTCSRGGQSLPTLAVTLHDLVIHDNKKWFGEADIRVDVLIVTGQPQGDGQNNYYMPKTASFSRVADGDSLPIGAGGLLAFHGPVEHFLDIFIMVSRDRQDIDNLADLMRDHLKSEELQSAAGALAGLAIAAPQVAAVTTAIGAAATLGDFAYRLLRNATGSTIGLYRNSHLQVRDGFGIGPHPSDGETAFRVKDLSFHYEITEENII